ncbi:MAG: FAD-binding oxidoreductase [SAR324 cluster bacterium]|nr:FAD-binding oxidoreductase [SAR324 cluster bacterium]
MDLSSHYLELYEALSSFIPKTRLIHDPLRTLAYGTDASFYRLIPQLVVKVETEEEVIGVLKQTENRKIPVTFRAAGTSLSGQSITDSVLVLLANTWQGHRIMQDGRQISLQPGVVGSNANRHLISFGRKIGPDPASINSAMIGGIAANNASGMCCGTAQNSYRTLKSMKIIFADGSTLDTGDSESKKAFTASRQEMLSQVETLAKQVKDNKNLFDLIQHKYRLKNTTGYSLNALIDFDDPFEIIQHLMIGSEGTLGFMSEITYNTVEDHLHKASSLMLFPNLKEACQAVAELKSTPVSAVELMDQAALRSVQDKPGMPGYLKTIPEETTALLVETRASDKKSLQQQIDDITKKVGQDRTIMPAEFTNIEAEYSLLWNIRKGLFPAVGAVRKTGTTVVIEDIAVPVPDLAQAMTKLHQLFQKYGYHEAIIFGHALEGNVHFVFTQDFQQPSEVSRYENFMDEVCRMVVGDYQGSLKAEHGTGRNMAPFVELEWGKEAYELMQHIKQIFDPDNLLNPGVILNNDNKIHLRNLKPLPQAHPLVDKCIECGFCEVYCPSRSLTLTPRQRIVSWREIARLKETGEDPKRLQAFESLYQYQGEATCAADGLCATGCPVSIDTGKLTKAIRADQYGSKFNKQADWVANNFAMVSQIARIGLYAVHGVHQILGSNNMEWIATKVRSVSGNRIPLWNRYFPKPGAPIVAHSINEANPLKVVYFPSCLSRMMGGAAKGDSEKVSLSEKIQALLRKANYEILYPANLSNLCCGLAFESKGMEKQGHAKRRELEKALLEATKEGEYPVLCDTSPCLYLMRQDMDARLKLYEPVEFIHEYLMSQLEFEKQPRTVALHPTCSLRKMGLEKKIVEVAQSCVENVIVPEDVGCCGFAGDRGFQYPELNASALQTLESSLPSECQEGYSNSKTCEIGLSVHSNRYYRSIVYLVDQCSRSSNSK